MALSSILLIGAVVLGLLGLWALARKARGGGRFLSRLAGLVMVVAAIGLGGTGVMLRNYRWLLEDVPVATITLSREAPQRFRAVLADGDAPREFVLLGDEWQLDARVIRWTLPAQISGLGPVYRLERLSGRYGDPKEELSEQRSVHDLRQEWDFWEFKQRWLADLPIAEARWGSAAYLPMLDGATYEVFISPRGGLVAKPADAETEALLDEAGW